MKRYDEVFKEHKASDILEQAEEPVTPGENCYVPHHTIIRDNHTTTKLKIVFDASAKSQGPSLNNCLYKGPKLTTLIRDVLLYFWTLVFDLTVDTVKVFLQRSTDKPKSDYLRFL